MKKLPAYCLVVLLAFAAACVVAFQSTALAQTAAEQEIGWACVDCHEKNKDKKAPNLAREPIANKWYASYNSLVRKYAFTNYGNSHRTTPGKFGAHASKLYAMLKKGHNDVKLSKPEMHRITLWLECNSDFFGAYENTKAQAEGKIVTPALN